MAPPVLALRGAAVRIASQVLFEGVDVAVAKGERVCLVGRNGSGKSTLLKALAGLVALDAGERFVQPRTSVAYLAQEPGLPATGALRDYVMGGLPEAERAGAEYRADAVLEGFGLDPARGLAGLSGGAARRGALGRGGGGGGGRPGAGVGSRAGGAAAGRADQPPGPADDRATRGGAAGLPRRARAGEPRPRVPDRAVADDLVARPRAAAHD